MADLVPTPIDLNDSTPAAPTSGSHVAVNSKWQAAAGWPRRVSAYLDLYAIDLSGFTPADVTGYFTVAHGLSGTPIVLGIKMTSDGAIWVQATEADGTNLYLVASAPGITGKAMVLLP